MTFGDKLRELRESLGWTREELAYLSGVAEQCIKSYEAGNTYPRFSNVQLLATALKVSLDIFPFCGTESKHKLLSTLSVEEIREKRVLQAEEQRLARRQVSWERRRRNEFRRPTSHQLKWQGLARMLREQGLTYAAVAEQLYQQSGVKVSSTTILNWLKRVEDIVIE